MDLTEIKTGLEVSENYEYQTFLANMALQNSHGYIKKNVITFLDRKLDNKILFKYF